MEKLPRKEYLHLIQAIKLEALDLGPEQSKNIKCPKCSERGLDRTMSLTRIYDGLLYHCFSASCGARGFTSSSKQLYSTKKRKKPFEPKILTRPLINLPDSILNLLVNKYHLNKDLILENGWKYDYLANRLAMPLYDVEGRQAGWIAKALSKTNTPKAITYWEKESPQIAMPLTELSGAKCVLVEDTISMLRLLPFVNSAALIGTHMPYETAFLLSKVAPRIVVALDADTWDNREVPIGIQLRNKFHLMFESFEVLRLTKDPKDMEHEEMIEQILSRI